MDGPRFRLLAIVRMAAMALMVYTTSHAQGGWQAGTAQDCHHAQAADVDVRLCGKNEALRGCRP